MRLHEQLTEAQYQPAEELELFQGKGFISIDQVQSPEQLYALFRHADVMKQIIQGFEIYRPLEGHTIAIPFYEPSTRTYLSFHSASSRLGAEVKGVQEMGQFSSALKGEDLADSMRAVRHATYASALILRHKEDSSSEVAQAAVDIPVINGGSGSKEHPTQALLDAYTIQSTMGRIHDLHVVLVGDLLYGRTVKSLAKLLALVDNGNRLTLVSPSELRMPAELVAELRQRIEVNETESLEEVTQEADVLYMTRVQGERFKNKADYERLKDHYILTGEMVKGMKEKSMVHHPLPRLNEIERSVDADERAKYFIAMFYGLCVRMALLDAILNPTPGRVQPKRRW